MSIYRAISVLTKLTVKMMMAKTDATAMPSDSLSASIAPHAAMAMTTSK